MTRYLRVRVGATRCLLPAGIVGTVGEPDACRQVGRAIDARRLAGLPVSGSGGSAVLLVGAGGRRWTAVLVDEVESFVDIGADEFVDVPAALPHLRALFDGLWYEDACGRFQSRVDDVERQSFGDRRALVRAIAPARGPARPGRTGAGSCGAPSIPLRDAAAFPDAGRGRHP